MTSVAVRPNSITTTQLQATTTAKITRAADGDYKTKGIGHEVKDADGDYKPTAAPNSAAASTASTTLDALTGMKLGG